MTECFVGEVQIFGFDFAPYQWALCNGATIPVQQNTVLFSLIGARYGGNGTTTFQLPNLCARATCSQGTGPGLTPRTIGEAFGEAGVVLTESTFPSHNHGVNVFSGGSGTPSGTPTAGGALSNGIQVYAPNSTPNTTLSPMALQPAGQSLAHENRQPFLALNFCIALAGEYPNFG